MYLCGDFTKSVKFVDLKAREQENFFGCREFSETKILYYYMNEMLSN